MRAAARGSGFPSESEASVMRVGTVYALPATVLLLGSLAGTAVAEVVTGTNGPDVLYGTAEADTIRAYKGADTVYARAGDDTVYGGLGADRIYGRTGGDRIFPGDDARKDVLLGGPGPDRITARGYDVVFAGDGDDTVRVIDIVGFSPKVTCGPGEDTVILPYGWYIGPFPDCEHVREAPSPYD